MAQFGLETRVVLMVQVVQLLQVAQFFQEIQALRVNLVDHLILDLLLCQLIQ
jgi:hypothetical protein